MPTRKENDAATTGGTKVTEKKAAAKSAAPKSAPGGDTSTKSSLQKKFEDFALKAGVEFNLAEERDVTLTGVKTRMLFVDFPAGTGKECIKELLWHTVTTDDLKGYSVEVQPDDELLMFYKD